MKISTTVKNNQGHQKMLLKKRLFVVSVLSGLITTNVHAAGFAIAETVQVEWVMHLRVLQP